MIDAVRTGSSSGGEREQRRVEKNFLKNSNLGLKRALEKDLEAFIRTKLIRMKCRSVRDTSWGLKPSNMAEKYDFGQKKDSTRKLGLIPRTNG